MGLTGSAYEPIVHFLSPADESYFCWSPRCCFPLPSFPPLASLYPILHPCLRAVWGHKIRTGGSHGGGARVGCRDHQSCVCLAQAIQTSQDCVSYLPQGPAQGFWKPLLHVSSLRASLGPLEWKSLGARLCLPLTAFPGRCDSDAMCEPQCHQ